MNLTDYKQIIDSYFDNVEPKEVIRRFEILGYEFENIDFYEDDIVKEIIEQIQDISDDIYYVMVEIPNPKFDESEFYVKIYYKETRSKEFINKSLDKILEDIKNLIINYKINL